MGEPNTVWGKELKSALLRLVEDFEKFDAKQTKHHEETIDQIKKFLESHSLLKGVVSVQSAVAVAIVVGLLWAAFAVMPEITKATNNVANLDNRIEKLEGSIKDVRSSISDVGVKADPIARIPDQLAKMTALIEADEEVPAETKQLIAGLISYRADVENLRKELAAIEAALKANSEKSDTAISELRHVAKAAEPQSRRTITLRMSLNKVNLEGNAEVLAGDTNRVATFAVHMGEPLWTRGDLLQTQITLVESEAYPKFRGPSRLFAFLRTRRRCKLI